VPESRSTSGQVLVAGESLVDVVVGPDGQQIDVAPGGAPLNIAVALARLGIPTRLATSFGDDTHGDLVGRHLEESAVQLLPGSRRSGRTSVARAVLDERHQATYEFDLAWDPPPLTLPEPCAAVHVGSLGTVVEPGASRVAALAAVASAAGVVVSYDPNVRPAVTGDRDPWPQVRDHAAAATIVKLSDEDAAHLQPGRDAADLVDELLAGDRTRLVGVTRGADGVLLATPYHRVEVPAVRVDVVDTVGAGDACMAGLLAALHVSGLLNESALAGLGVDDLSSAGTVAAAVAAATCQRRGANPPWRRELAADAWPSRPA
jgi:fructokinase